MKYIIIVFALLAALSVGAQPADEQTLLTIDNKSVSLGEFERLYTKNNTGATFDSASLNEYLRLFIDYKLKVVEAEMLGMDKNQEFLNELEVYRIQLEKPYLTDASVDDSLAREAYEHMKTDVKAAHILVRCPENASAADTLKAYKRMETIRKRAVNGEDFAKLARETSEDPSAVRNNGDLGFFTAFSMIYEFEKVAYATEVGVVSPIFRTKFGYHIMKVTDRRPNPGRIRAAHLMVRIEQNADEAAQKAATDKIKIIADSLAAGADWTQMVIHYSDDPSTRTRQGDLQWFSTGSMVADFENAAFALKNIGDISAPVRTSYGWHIIKLLDKKPLDSFENLQEQIKKQLSRDVRSKMAQKSVIERLKKEYNFTEDKSALNEFMSRVDTSILNGKWTADKAKGLNKIIFSIADTIKFTQNDYAENLSKRGPVSSKVPIEVMMANDYKNLVEQTILDYERKQLPRKYPDYRYLQTEYHDGILLFALMDKMVWTKASTDSTGLASFYEANKERYMWGDRAEVAICSYKGDAITGSIVKIVVAKLEAALKAGVKKGNYTEQSKAALQKLGINPDSVDMQVTAKKYNIVDGKDAGAEGSAADAKYCDIDGTKIDMNAWDRNKFKIHYGQRTEVLYLVKQVPPTPKTLDECRGSVIADYQDVLEKEWLAQLRAKHTVKIDEKVFNSMIKKQ